MRFELTLLLCLTLACQPVATPLPTDSSPPCFEEIPYDGIDQDCDGSDLTDVDGDGHAPPADCDDADAARYPGAEEVPYDGIDQDCDESDADDLDGDGYLLAEDCDDSLADVNPAAPEVCNGIDDDCDGTIDVDATDATLWYADTDADGYGDLSVTERSCEPRGGTDATDCDDTNPWTHPGAPEECGDGVDNNCDGYVDQMVAGLTHYSIQAALDAMCAEGDTVWVSPGTYVENVVISSSVVLEAVESADTTTVDGSDCTRGPDQCEVIEIAASDVTVRNLTITGGTADLGGGIFVDLRLGVRVEDSVLVDNIALERGGGMYLRGCGALSGNVISGNSAALGGGLYLACPYNGDDNSLTIDSNQIVGNFARVGGGGAYENGIDLRALWSGNDIRDNTSDLGGGIQGVYGLWTVGNTIQDNTAFTQGGGIWYSNEWTGSGDTITGNAPDDVYQN